MTMLILLKKEKNINMINLAGNKEADKQIRKELYLAGIEIIPIEGKGEVPYTIGGRIGNWKLTRAWTYWIAKVVERKDGLSLNEALLLHNKPNPIDFEKKLGDSIRSGGHCGCPSPDEYGAQPVYNENFIDRLKEIGEYKEVIFDGITYPDITVGKISELCNKGKLDIKRYVDIYHIDDQIGLNEFAKFLKI